MLSCNYCDGKNLIQILSTRTVPFAQNFVFDRFEDSVNCASAAINIYRCYDCKTAFNVKFNGSLIDYNDQYQNEQQLSPVFRNHLSEVISWIANTYPDRSTKITEVGCGKGYFIQALRDAGYTDLSGFDTAYEGNDPTIKKTYFSTGQGVAESKLLIIRHVLEHIEKPFEFLQSLAKTNNYNGRIYIEVPDLDWINSHGAFWDFYHEHVNYFSADFFRKNFTNAKIKSLFEGQYIGILLELSEFKTPKKMANESRLDNVLVDFDDSLSKVMSQIKSYKEIYVWGASSKGVMICNYLDPQKNRIVWLVDINPKKWNKYIPVTGHKILSPDEFKGLALSKGALVLVANENYKTEIENALEKRVAVKSIEQLSREP